MTHILTSWKEIAHYVGKGVRTVQRWEREFGFPVRRPDKARHVVAAHRAEIDAWLSEHPWPKVRSVDFGA